MIAALGREKVTKQGSKQTDKKKHCGKCNGGNKWGAPVKQLLGAGWETFLDMAAKEGLAEEMLLKPEPRG